MYRGILAQVYGREQASRAWVTGESMEEDDMVMRVGSSLVRRRTDEEDKRAVSPCRARLDMVILFLMPASYHPLFQLCITLFQMPAYFKSILGIYRGLRAIQNRQSPHTILPSSTVMSPGCLYYLYLTDWFNWLIWLNIPLIKSLFIIKSFIHFYKNL